MTEASERWRNQPCAAQAGVAAAALNLTGLGPEKFFPKRYSGAKINR